MSNKNLLKTSTLVNNHDKCLVCDSERITDLTNYQKAFLCRCENCGFVFSKRIPTLEEIYNHYNNYSYGKNDYISPITLKRYEELLLKFEKFRKTNKILDVGCGNGHFLSVAKKRGWDVYGTEFPEDAIEVCRNKGIQMFAGELNIDDFDLGTFDIVISIEVLEHINNPKEELGKFYKILRKGGLVYITTPNFNSLIRYRLKQKYTVINYPGHLSYYTPKTLKKAFQLSGFSKWKIDTTGISLTRYRKSKGTSNQQNISSSSDDEKIRNQVESKWYLQLAKRFVNGTLTLFGKGDSLKGWFVKK
jgi:2-polyprenyl-3-methyl-5-hydroxy-6-metoxy-1,4-benzoquinol methylase